MRTSVRKKVLFAVAIFAVASAVALTSATRPSVASSHREAPLITADPLADNTDTYAFRSTEAGRSGFVTILANWIPFEEPSGGPHFYKFDDTVLYEIKIDNTGDGSEDVTYQFRFTTQFKNPDSILGMAAPNQAVAGTGGVEPLITSLDDPDYNEPQTYTVTRIDNTTNKNGTVVASGLITPPNNIGERSTPNYETVLGQAGIYNLPNGGKVFAGQRDEGFYIDVGGIFDTLKLKSIGATGGFDSTAGFNVNTIGIEVPIQSLTRSGNVPSGPTASDAVIGVWATSSRRTTQVIRPEIGVRHGQNDNGPFRQVSRLGEPLVNEVIIPVKLKDTFNASEPEDDSQFASFVADPQLAQLLKAVFGINIPSASRTDLVAIFATGIPVNPVTGPNYTTFLSDGLPHEMMRLNVAIPPSPDPSRLGLLAGDVAGFPNGRRVFDDVVDIELRAVAGGTPFTPATNIAPNNTLGDGVSNNDVPFLTRFPYLGTPHSGNSTSGPPHAHHTNNMPPLP